MVGVLGFTLLISFINMIISAILVGSYVSPLFQQLPFRHQDGDPNWEGAHFCRDTDAAGTACNPQNRSAYPTTTFRNVTRCVVAAASICERYKLLVG